MINIEFVSCHVELSHGCSSNPLMLHADLSGCGGGYSFILTKLPETKDPINHKSSSGSKSSTGTDFEVLDDQGNAVPNVTIELGVQSHGVMV